MSLTRIKSTGIEANAVISAVIADESVTGEKIAANTITLDKLEPNVVTQIASSGGGVVLMTNTLISSNILIPEGKNALSIGPVTIAVGSNVTIASGQRWLVL